MQAETRDDVMRLARHVGVLSRWTEAEKDPRPRMFSEVDVDGVHRRGLSRDDMAALVLEHRAALGAVLRRMGLSVFATEIEAARGHFDFARSLLSMYRVGADALGFDERSR